jgi:type IV secretory pathway VirB2 component (pilin)
MKLLVNITIAVAFIAIIAAGVMLTTGWISQSTAWKWKELIKKVVLGIALLGLSGVILHTINPNFFKTNISYQLIRQL